MSEIVIRPEEIAKHFQILEDGQGPNAFESAEKLAKIGGEEVVNQLVILLSSANYDTVYLAASALSKCSDNSMATASVFELIKSGEQPFIKSILTETLAGFDCSEYFIELLKLYLFGSFKVSAMAKVILDEQEFAITPRVIRKAEKHLK
ncbi:MAG: HEAT repeat domain-containing protein, partial [Cytophagales bacterium]|nr:HEAT repeat domain-containing protein [Cytophagales bacterium]